MSGALAIIGVLLAAAAPTFAEHSFTAEFDSGNRVTLQGTVTRVDWTNPNAFFYVDVKDAVTGKTQNWVVEANCKTLLSQRGWTRNTVNIGTVITVPNASRARDGSRRVNSRTIEVAGKVLPLS